MFMGIARRPPWVLRFGVGMLVGTRDSNIANGAQPGVQSQVSRTRFPWTQNWLGSIRDSYVFVIESLERQEVGLWTSGQLTPFPGVAFGGARADTRAAARGARGAVGPERGRGIEGSDRAWCGRGSALSALRERGGGFARYGAGSAALPVQGLRQDLQRAERYAAVGLAPQGTLAVVRGVAGEGGDGEGLGGALRRGGEHGVPLASPVSGGGAERFGGAQGDRGSGRDHTSWRGPADGARRARHGRFRDLLGHSARHGGGIIPAARL